jgi:cytochrome c biogenesis factor
MLHLATVLALAIVGAAAFAAWRAAPSLQVEEHANEDAAGTSLQRRRFMALGGLALCAWFAIVILATEIPALVLHPCAR